jgi:D-glycero-alpha-D-manno-heptose-7-phosphate kinase
LKQQNKNISNSDKFTAQQQMVTLTYDLRDALHANNLDDFGKILHEGWILKKSLTDNISTSHVDNIYEQGISAGACGGKLRGAGGGGFILFYCPKEKQESFRDTMKEYRILSFKFDNSGSKLIYVGENDYHGF